MDPQRDILAHRRQIDDHDAHRESQMRQAMLETRRRFEFYLVVLSFTMLGFLLQRAEPSPSLWVAVCEIVSWACLAGSGALGLFVIHREGKNQEYWAVSYSSAREARGSAPDARADLREKTVGATGSRANERTAAGAASLQHEFMNQFIALWEQGLKLRLRSIQVTLLVAAFALLLVSGAAKVIPLPAEAEDSRAERVGGGD